MTGHLTPQARAIADAMTAGDGLKALADALYAEPELSDASRAVAIDIGTRLYVVALSGYGPLDDPRAFLYVADEVS